jgi:hypothetical protein
MRFLPLPRIVLKSRRERGPKQEAFVTQRREAQLAQLESDRGGNNELLQSRYRIGLRLIVDVHVSVRFAVG